jgi:hypothetical protein
MKKHDKKSAISRLLKAVEALTELRTGKMCTATVKAAPVFGFGKFTVKTDDGTFEHYVCPFSVVTVFTPTI